MLFLACIMVLTCLKLLMFFAMPFPMKLFICNYLLAICLMPVLYFSLLGTTLASILSQELMAETFYYHASTFADSTKATYKSHRDLYLRFCIFMGYNPIQLVLLSYLSMLPFWLDLLNFLQLRPTWVLYLYCISSSVCLTLSLIIGLLNLF